MRRQDNITAIIVTVVVGLLLAITIGATAIFSSGFTNWDVSTWTWSFAPAHSEESKDKQTEESTEETTTVSSAMRLAKNNFLIVEELDTDDLFYTYHILFNGDNGFFTGIYHGYVEDTDTFYMGLSYDVSKLLATPMTADSELRIMSDCYNAVLNNDEEYYFNLSSDGEYPISNFSEHKGQILDGRITLQGTAVNDYYDQPFTFIIDEFALLPTNVAKPGYVFAGWYTDEDCTEKYEKPYVYEGTALYAAYSVPVSVTFIDSETEYEDNISVVFNTALSEEQFPELVREGYTLVGWSYEDGTLYNGEVITAKTSLSAVWEQTKYTVTFYVNGKVYKTVKVLEGATFQEALDIIGFNQTVVYNIQSVDENVELDLNNITTDITASIDAGAVNEKNFIDNSYVIALVIAGLIICITVGVALSFKKRR